MTNLNEIKKQIIGLTIKEAAEIVPNYKLFVVKKEGKHLATILDYRTDRIKVTTVDEKITEIICIG